MPYAYSTDIPKDNSADQIMLNILQEVNKQHCRCAAGAAGREVRKNEHNTTQYK